MDDSATAEKDRKGVSASQRVRLFYILSGINGWSLLVVGILSLGLSLFVGAVSGILVSIAIAIHGSLELTFRGRCRRTNSYSVAKRLAWNQLGLATLVSLYLGYQALSLDESAVLNALINSPAYEILMLYPEELRLQMMESLPLMIGVFYALAAVLTWIVCVATAVYYGRVARWK